MAEAFTWWLLSVLIGALGLPYAAHLFRFLPDRGYCVSRVLGLLLVVYPLWMASVVGILRYTAWGAMVVLVLVAAGALYLSTGQLGDWRRSLLQQWPRIVTAEVVFALIFAGIAFTRSFEPAIADTEKPFEFAFFNGVLQSPRMPAADPWYLGEPMSYYYGGYLITAVYTHLTRVLPETAFNLGVALTGALAAQGAFGLGLNGFLLLRRTFRAKAAPAPAEASAKSESSEGDTLQAGEASPPGSPAQPRADSDRHHRGGGLGGAAIAAGLASVILFLLIGNLVGVVEMARIHGWTDGETLRRLGIQGITDVATSTHWYPDDHWFWWRATRLGSPWNVIEFPFFSFLLGDLHAHVMVLPFTMLGLTTVINLVTGGSTLHRTRPATTDAKAWVVWLFRRAEDHHALYLAVLAGMLALINSWDQPIFLGLLFVALLINGSRGHGLTGWSIIEAALLAAPVAVASFVLYLPFFMFLRPATEGVVPVEVSRRPPGIDMEAMVFPPHHFLLFWGPLLLTAGGGLLLQAARRRIWRLPREELLTALALTLSPHALWLVAMAAKNRSLGAVFEEIGARGSAWAGGSYWLMQAFVLVLLYSGLLILLGHLRRPAGVRDGSVAAPVLLTAGLALLTVMELFYVREPSPGRTNTLFKFSYGAWLLLATGGSAVLMDALVVWWRSRRVHVVLSAWVALVAVVVVLAAVYPVTAMMNRTRGFSGPRTLDGLAFLRQLDPDEYDAVQWLRDNLKGRPHILEAAGGDYSQAGRISARTGFPTVIGWPFHEAQERGAGGYDAKAAEVAARQRDVDTMYTTTDLAEARRLLSYYRIQYVVVGRLEQERYKQGITTRFEQLGRPVYRQGAVTVYAVNDGPESAGLYQR